MQVTLACFLGGLLTVGAVGLGGRMHARSVCRDQQPSGFDMDSVPTNCTRLATLGFCNNADSGTAHEVRARCPWSCKICERDPMEGFSTDQAYKVEVDTVVQSQKDLEVNAAKRAAIENSAECLEAEMTGQYLPNCGQGQAFMFTDETEHLSKFQVVLEHQHWLLMSSNLLGKRALANGDTAAATLYFTKGITAGNEWSSLVVLRRDLDPDVRMKAMAGMPADTGAVEQSPAHKKARTAIGYMGAALSAMATGATPPDPDAFANAAELGLSLSAAAADPMQDVLSSLKRSSPHTADDADANVRQTGQNSNDETAFDVEAVIAAAAVASAGLQISPEALAAARKIRDDENDPLL